MGDADSFFTGRKRLSRAGMAPLLPLAVCLMAGIVLAGFFRMDMVPALVLLAAAVVAGLLLGRWPMAQSVATALAFLLLGMLVGNADGRGTVPDGQWTEAVVASTPAGRPKTLMVNLLLSQTGEQRRCYVWKDRRSQSLAVGDALVVCLHDGHFIARDGWRRGGSGINGLSAWQRVRVRALVWRSRLVARMLSARPGATATAGDDATAVVAAMALGDKSALSRQLRHTYSATGAAHILALSGLHLGIIYMLLSRLTLGRRRWWLSQVLVVLAIWAFAVLTGLSASIVRSATMITVYAVFALGGRRHATLNVLCFTAIVMLLADPQALFDVGFQLSFAAMAAILLFCPLFQALVSARWLMAHRLLHWLYGLAAVSVAAQLGTAPLVAFYFGQLPTWFLLTNVVVVPAATLILHTALLALLFPAALGGVLLWMAGALNTVLAWMATWPLASVDGLHPSVLQVAMCYVLLGVVYALLATYSPASARCR